jgi:hypothetical protein
MGEILGMGMTHAPMFQFPDENMADILRRDMTRERTPVALRDPQNWPAPMRAEWGDDEGLSAAHRHREIMVEGFRRLRAELDAFNPDFVLIWGDDQYENFKEDIVPPFCVYIYDQLDCLPYRRSGVINTGENVWGLPEDTVVPVRGHRAAGNHLARRLIESHFDVGYAYKPHHHPTLAHAFMRTLIYLDYDQRGFPYPILPFHVNCYGSDLMRQMGGQLEEGEVPPPAPSPARCFDLGRAIRSILEESPWRAVVIGSSSWSHGFLTRKHHGLYPDVESDRLRLEDLKAGRHTSWRDLSLDTLVDAGQHEFLNWICLAGAMADRTAEIVAWEETHIFNSDKCAALFRL